MLDNLLNYRRVRGDERAGVNVHIPSRQAFSPGSTTSYQPREIVMFRTSSFLAIALSVTTIAFASDPAAAFVKQPQVSKAYNPHLRTTVGRARYPMDRLGGSWINGPRVAGG